MKPLPDAIADYAKRLRAELRALDCVDEMLIDEVVTAAIRLKLLHADPRALDPMGDPSWARIHEKAIRAFFRSYESLTRRQRSPQSSAPRSSTPTPAQRPSASANPVPSTRTHLAPPAPSAPLPSQSTEIRPVATTSPSLETERPFSVSSSSLSASSPRTATPLRRPDPERLLRAERRRARASLRASPG